MSHLSLLLFASILDFTDGIRALNHVPIVGQRAPFHDILEDQFGDIPGFALFCRSLQVSFAGKVKMTDTLSKKQRSRVMSKVRGADTKPEWILRCGLHRLGYRYRLRNKDLPGKPDLVFPKYRTVVFVHGCYWHRHPGCKDASTPKSNQTFWTNKFSENVERDQRTEQALTALGWRVLVVWECDLMKNTVQTIQNVASWLRQEDATADAPREKTPAVERDTLLAIAEEKVRYRIASYENHQDTDNPEGIEIQQP